MRKLLRALALLGIAFSPVIARCAEWVLWPWWVIFIATFVTVWAVTDYADRLDPHRYDSMPNGSRDSTGMLCAILTMIFLPLVLRSTGFVDWPWQWVLAPLFVPAVLAFGGLGLLSILNKSRKDT